MTDNELLMILNRYYLDRVNNGCGVDNTVATLNKISEINSIFASFIRDKMDPMRKSVFLNQLNAWSSGGPTSREFTGLFRGN